MFSSASWEGGGCSCDARRLRKAEKFSLASKPDGLLEKGYGVDVRHHMPDRGGNRNLLPCLQEVQRMQ